MGDMKNEPYSPKMSSAGRFWGFNRITGSQDGTNQTLYMTRMWFGRLRFHIFHRGDQDPDCHDHPWGFWTFPLCSYVEEVLTPIRDTITPGEPEKPTRYQRRLEIVRAFRFHYRPATYRHRVLGLYDPLIFTRQQKYFPAAIIPTFVWREKPSRKWGFTKERNGVWCWVPWKTYVFGGGKNAPCE